MTDHSYQCCECGFEDFKGDYESCPECGSSMVNDNDDIELLPLPEKVEVDKHLPTGVRIYAYDANTLKNYARANVAHATAAKDAEIAGWKLAEKSEYDLRMEAEAEIERLRAEADRWKTNYNAAIELKGRAFAESGRLSEALRDAAEALQVAGLPGNAKLFRSMLRDHDQEDRND